MIYDKKIVIAKLPEGVGTPLQAPLEPVFTAFCGELEVFHTRYWKRCRPDPGLTFWWSCLSSGTLKLACMPVTKVKPIP